MPALHVITNLGDDRVSDELIRRLSRLTAELTNRIEEVIEVIVQPNQRLAFHGTLAPAAFVTLVNVTKWTEERARRAAERLTALLVAELGLKAERIFIVFDEKTPTTVARGDRLVKDLRADWSAKGKL
ncbi:hypothetical protein M3Y99_00565500 [Aphelenchoides fujianensis]|nr:hypothetical protein M3Y99_00565500 [Aphelenchoides fujianensis]